MDTTRSRKYVEIGEKKGRFDIESFNYAEISEFPHYVEDRPFPAPRSALAALNVARERVDPNHLLAGIFWRTRTTCEQVFWIQPKWSRDHRDRNRKIRFSR